MPGPAITMSRAGARVHARVYLDVSALALGDFQVDGLSEQCECSEDIAMSGKLDNPQRPTAVVCDCGVSFPIESR